MKNKLLMLLTVMLFIIPNINFGQAPTLGTTVDFVLFSTDGAVSDVAQSSLLTGNVGTGNGSSTAFGNVNGGMHDADATSALCTSDLLLLYGELDAAIPITPSLAPALGNGQILYPGVYEITSVATLDMELILDAQGDPDGIFIFQIQAAFSTTANSKVKLINEALACNVFWKVEGLVDMATGTTMRGTIIANNDAIVMSVGDTLEGRALSINGAITVDDILAYTPTGCGSAVHLGPTAPTLGTAACYGIFSSAGSVSNTGITNVVGDVGTNVGSTTGFDPLLVTGTIHAGPDASTSQCAADLLIAYNFVSVLMEDIELLYPSLFGRELVLTPHTYLLDAATMLTDTVYLNAEGNVDAVFVIKISGALTTAVNSNVKLINGTQSKNVYWVVEGAVSINDNSKFRGTIICNNGALGALSTGVLLDGRALTTGGDLTTATMTVAIPSACGTTGFTTFSTNPKGIVNISPNPFNRLVTVVIDDALEFNNTELLIYTITGEEIINIKVVNQVTTIETSNFPSGIYFYKIINKSKTIQSGRLVSQQ